MGQCYHRWGVFCFWTFVVNKRIQKQIAMFFVMSKCYTSTIETAINFFLDGNKWTFIFSYATIQLQHCWPTSTPALQKWFTKVLYDEGNNITATVTLKEQVSKIHTRLPIEVEPFSIRNYLCKLAHTYQFSFILFYHHKEFDDFDDNIPTTFNIFNFKFLIWSLGSKWQWCKFPIFILKSAQFYFAVSICSDIVSSP